MGFVYTSNGAATECLRLSARATECPATECPATECPATECPGTECPVRLRAQAISSLLSALFFKIHGSPLLKLYFVVYFIMQGVLIGQVRLG
jgi:hypothetical protein